MMTTILLVDDDPLQAYVRKSALDKVFSDVRRVSGPEALCLIEQTHFSSHLALVISGSHMPGLSGVEFVTELGVRLPWLPVLVVGREPSQLYAAVSNRLYFVEDPVDIDELLRVSRQLVAHHKISAA